MLNEVFELQLFELALGKTSFCLSRRLECFLDFTFQLARFYRLLRYLVDQILYHCFLLLNLGLKLADSLFELVLGC